MKIATYYNNAKSAFSFVFDDGCYRESTLDAYENLKEVYEKTGVKIKITSAQTVGFLHEWIIKMWKDLIDEGYFDICGHSIDHCLCYNDVTDPALLHKDAAGKAIKTGSERSERSHRGTLFKTFSVYFGNRCNRQKSGEKVWDQQEYGA